MVYSISNCRSSKFYQGERIIMQNKPGLRQPGKRNFRPSIAVGSPHHELEEWFRSHPHYVPRGLALQWYTLPPPHHRQPHPDVAAPPHLHQKQSNPYVAQPPQFHYRQPNPGVARPPPFHQKQQSPGRKSNRNFHRLRQESLDNLRKNNSPCVPDSKNQDAFTSAKATSLVNSNIGKISDAVEQSSWFTRPERNALYDTVGFAYLWRNFENSKGDELKGVLVEIHSRLTKDEQINVGLMRPETFETFNRIVGEFTVDYQFVQAKDGRTVFKKKTKKTTTKSVEFLGGVYLQGCHGTGKTGNLKVHFSRQGKHREFAKKYSKYVFTQGIYHQHRENLSV